MRWARIRRVMLAIGFAVMLFVGGARDARASHAMSFGVHYWFVETGVFEVAFATDVTLTSFLSAGGRLGMMLTSSDPTVGIPIDLLLRLHPTPRFDIEIAAGPWILIDAPDAIAGHFSFGVQIKSGAFSFGPEVSYLEPDPMLGGRLAYRF